MGPDVLSAHVSTPETDESLAGFAEDWDGRGSPLAGRPRAGIKSTAGEVCV